MCHHDDGTPNFTTKKVQVPLNIKGDNEIKVTNDPKDELSKISTSVEMPHLAATDSRVSPHLEEKFVLFEDKDAKVVLDIHEEFQLMQDGFAHNELSYPPKEKIPIELNLKRGLHGVYDIEDLVTVLQEENAIDICVIEMPKELMYAEYLVLASGRSSRHLAATMEFVRKLYKKKKSKMDKFVVVQGEASKTWLAMDMGNIVLHLFLPEERKKYDIETLWSVGEQYDDHCNRPQGALDSRLQAHLNFLETLKPLGGNESTNSYDIKT